MMFVIADGGREKAGFKGSTGDCVVRAIAIATGADYKAVYEELYQIAKDFKPVQRKTKKHLKHIAKINASPSPRLGVHLLVSDSYLESRGYCPVKTKCLLDDALFSEGTFIVYTRRHFSVIKDGALFDSYDSRMTMGVFSEKKIRTVTRYWKF